MANILKAYLSNDLFFNFFCLVQKFAEITVIFGLFKYNQDIHFVNIFFS